MTMAQAAQSSARRPAEVCPDDLAKAEVDGEEKLRIREEKRGREHTNIVSFARDTLGEDGKARQPSFLLLQLRRLRKGGSILGQLGFSLISESMGTRVGYKMLSLWQLASEPGTLYRSRLDYLISACFWRSYHGWFTVNNAGECAER